MPRFEKDGLVRETALPRLAVQYRAAGWKETKARTKRVKEADVKHTEHVHAPFDKGGSLEPAEPVTNDSNETQVVVHPDAAEAPVEPSNTK